jgi:VanZ family protein
LAWLPTALYGGFILLWALQPAPRLPRIKHVDKYVHMIVYGVLSVLAYRSLVRSRFRFPAANALWIALAVGVADEGMQLLGGVRTADRLDVLADGTGAVLAMMVVLLFRRKSRERSHEASGGS